MLKIKNVSKTYINSDNSHNEAIKNISLDIQDGEFVAFVGPSGCGKSTILKLISGLDHPSAGNIYAGDVEIKNPNKDRGIVFQHFALFPWLTVYENIAFGLRLQNKNQKEINDIVSRYLKIIGLDYYKDKYPNSLSGGMQQRVAIARTLANDPKMLLLDEPFGALDVQTRSQLQEFLAVLWEETRKTTILVTHDVEEAIYLADRVYILSTRPGKIKETIAISLPRPRRPELRFNEGFLRIKKHISYIIRSEAIKSSLEKDHLQQGNVLRIGLDAWLGNTPFYIAKDLNLYSHHSIDTELLSIEKDEDRMGTWKKGEVDLRNLPLDTAVLLKERYPELKIVSVLNRSNGGDALVSKKDVGSIHDLRGKKIAVEKMWISHFFLLYLLQKAGMSSSDVTIVDMPGSDIGSALISGLSDAAILWEPWLSKLIELGDYKILADTKSHPILYDVLVGSEELITSRYSEIDKLKKVWLEAIDIVQKDKAESARIAASYIGISEREVSEGLDKIQLENSFDSKELISLIEECQKVLAKEGLLKKHFDAKELINHLR